MNLISDKWPLIYEDKLRVIDKKKSIAIACMWTEIQIIEGLITDTNIYDKINTIGNSYTINSIIGIIINLSSNRLEI